MKKLKVLILTILCMCFMTVPVMAATGPNFSWREGTTPYWYNSKYWVTATFNEKNYDKSDWKEFVKWHKEFMAQMNNTEKKISSALSAYNTANKAVTKANTTKNSAEKAMNTASKTYENKAKKVKTEKTKLDKLKKDKKATTKQIKAQQKKYNNAKKAAEKAKKTYATAKAKYNNAKKAYDKAVKTKKGKKDIYTNLKKTKQNYAYTLDSIEREVGALLSNRIKTDGAAAMIIYICDGKIIGTKQYQPTQGFTLLNIKGKKYVYVDHNGIKLSMKAAFDYYKTKASGDYTYVYMKKTSTPYSELTDIAGGNMQIRYLLDGAEYTRDICAIGTKNPPQLKRFKNDEFLYTDALGNILGQKIISSKFGSNYMDYSKNYEEAVKYYKVSTYAYAGAVLETYIVSNPYIIY